MPAGALEPPVGGAVGPPAAGAGGGLELLSA